MVDEDQFKGWAEYYDYIYSEDGGDVQFYLDEIRQTDGRVLEIGCGTGRIYLDALEIGADIYGFDISEEMLEKLREKAGERGLDTKVRQAKMEDFNYDKKFDLIIIPFNTFMHNLTTEEQISTLENCKEHLKEDGKLIVDFYIPDFEKVAEGTGEGSRSTEKVEIEGEEYERVVEVNWESEVEQIRTVKNELYDSQDEIVWENEFKTKLVSKREFELLLKLVEFSEWSVYQGFDREELEKPVRSVWEVQR